MNGLTEAIRHADLSLSEDDEGARFAGVGLGFLARGLGAGFSVEEKNIVHTGMRIKNGFKPHLRYEIKYMCTILHGILNKK